MENEKTVTLKLSFEQFSTLIFGLSQVAEHFQNSSFTPEEIQEEIDLINSIAAKLFEVLPIFVSRDRLQMLNDVLTLCAGFARHD